jgi:hypothetical protein
MPEPVAHAFPNSRPGPSRRDAVTAHEAAMKKAVVAALPPDARKSFGEALMAWGQADLEFGLTLQSVVAKKP